MSLTTLEREYLALGDDLSTAEKEYVDAVMDSVQDLANDRGMNVARDDRCARLESAVVRFINESRTP